MSASTPTVEQPRPKRRWSRQARHQAFSGWAFSMPFFLAFCLVFVAPIVTSIRASLFNLKASGGGAYGGGQMKEVFVGLENFKVAASDPAFWAGMGRVMLFGIVQIPVMILLALGLALLLDSFLVKRSGFWRLTYFLPYAIPGLIAAIIWGYLYVPEISPFAAGLPNIDGQPFFLSGPMLLWSMANMTTWTYTGYNMLIFLAALQSIPPDLYEAARIDGASGWRITTRIKIPMVSPAALLAVLLSIVGTVQLFSEPFVMKSLITGIPYSYTPMMMAFGSARNYLTPSGDGPASAISILMALIAGALAILYFIAQKKVNK